MRRNDLLGASVAACLILLVISGASLAQSGREADGRAAEQAGRLPEALTHYVAALQSVADGSADDQRLRETIIKLAQRMSPAPAVSDEATRYMARGQAAVEIAKGPEDFKRAAAEFQRALRIAPWLANAYYNLGVVQEKAGQSLEAMRSFKLYLAAAPSAPDAQQVRNRIFGLEYKAEREKEDASKAEQERLAKQREEEQRKARQTAIAGDWYNKADRTEDYTTRYQVTVIGNQVEIRPTGFYQRSTGWRMYKLGSGAAPSVWRGTIDGLTITGTHYGDNSHWRGGGNYTRPMRGSVSPDGSQLRLRYGIVDGTGAFPTPSRWVEDEQDLVLWR